MNKTPSSVYRIRMSDCDIFGHLNNSRYLDYFINAREDHLKDNYNFDLPDYYRNNGQAWVVGAHEIAYLRPALYNETVLIQSALITVAPDFLLLEAMMMNESRDHLKSLLRTRFIPINAKTGKKEAHLPEFMEWARQIEYAEIDSQASLQDRIKDLVTELKSRQVVE